MMWLPPVGQNFAVHLTNGEVINGTRLPDLSQVHQNVRMSAPSMGGRSAVLYEIDPGHIIAWSQTRQAGEEPW